MIHFIIVNQLQRYFQWLISLSRSRYINHQDILPCVCCFSVIFLNLRVFPSNEVVSLQFRDDHFLVAKISQTILLNMFSHLQILKDTRDVTPFQTETSADKDLSVARQSAKQKNIIIVIKKSICKVSQNCPASASINQTLLFCCVVFYLVFFCFASFLIIVSDCISTISTSPLAFFCIV